MTVQLSHDIRSMSFGGLDAQAQCDRNFLAAFAFGQELYDLALTWRQAIARAIAVIMPCVAFQISIQDHLGNAGSEEGLVAPQRVHSGYQITPGVGL
jgi:hypothetical protein